MIHSFFETALIYGLKFEHVPNFLFLTLYYLQYLFMSYFALPTNVVNYFKVSLSGLITSVGDEERASADFFLLSMWFLFGGVFSSSRCLGYATLFNMTFPGPSV